MSERSTPVVIIGCGGFGREVADIVEAVNARTPTFELLGFLDDDDRPRPELERRGLSLLGPIAALATVDARYVIGIGQGEVRRELDHRALTLGATPLDRLVHPTASMGADVESGPGLVVAAGARITTNIRFGRHVHLNLNVTVGHDATVDDYATLNPGVHVSGGVRLGEAVMLGSGAVINQNLTIGRTTTVGSGAVVVKDLPPGVTAVGVPARFADGAASMGA